MKKEFNITGLDCGHCALTLEKYLQKIEGVSSCTINFSTSKLFLDIDDGNSRTVMKEINKTIKVVNPSVRISESEFKDNTIKLYDIILYVIGLIVGICVILINMNKWLFYPLLVLSALLMGYKTYYKAILQLRYFKINENTLITLSLIGAVLVGESMEGLMVIALYTLGKMLEARAVNYSRKSISTLISIQPDYAVIYSNGKEKRVKPEMANINDIIIVKAGEKVPLDGIVVEGSASVDKKHLTGESVPVNVKTSDIIESGSVVLDSTILIQVTSVYKDSVVSKIMNLVSSASSKKSKTESFISKFSTWYTLGVLIMSVFVFGIVWLITKDINTSVYRGLIFLVVSCPCAFAISVPLSYFSGIGVASKLGILIKGSNYLDSCSNLNEIVFDKTGTLTTGEFVVTKYEYKKGIDKKELLEIVSAGERNSLHPIGRAICNFSNSEKLIKITKYKERAGEGIEFYYDNKKYFVGRSKNKGKNTIVEIYIDDISVAKIYLQDEIKKNVKESIVALKNLGVRTTMLTGDSKSVASEVATELNIDNYKSELMPEDKYKIIEQLKESKKIVGFVGDGINDAPALTLSDVGISMGIMGSPATIESSDVVIADDNIARTVDLIKISRRTKRIVLQNIIFAGVTKLAFLLLGSLGITGMLLAVFADVGVTLLAILNSLRVLSYKSE